MKLFLNEDPVDEKISHFIFQFNNILFLQKGEK